MKITHLYIFLLFVCALLLVGCNDDKSIDSGLTITHSDVEFEANGGTGTISFSSAGAVSVKSDKDWIQISSPEPTSVSFTVSPNSDIMSRSALIELTADNKTEVVTITQMGIVLDTPENFTVAPARVSTVLEFYTNTTDLTVSSADGWANATIENGKLVVTPESNPGAERSTTLTVTSHWKTVTTTLIQLPFLETTEVALDGLGNSFSFEVHHSIGEFDGTWSAQGVDNWLHVTSDGFNIIVTADKNETGAPRYSTIMITVDNVSIPVAVTQSGIVDHYNYFLGEWKLSYKDGAATDTITLVQKEYNESYIMQGLRYDLIVTYDDSSKQLELVNQYVGTYSIYYIFFCVQSTVDASFSWGKDVGFKLTFNGDEANNKFAITDNGVWKSSKADGFLLYGFKNPTPSVDGRVGVLADYEKVVDLHR